MKRSVSGWAALLSLCLGLTLFLSHCSRGERESTSALAPDFTLKTIEGQEITLSKLKGKVVLLDFWATWCGPCRESIPHLIQLYKTYKENGFEVIGMSMDRGDVDVVHRFGKSMDIPYPIIIAAEDVSRNYGIVGLPTTILIDKEGRIREKIAGFSTTIAKQMFGKVETLTSQKP